MFVHIGWQPSALCDSSEAKTLCQRTYAVCMHVRVHIAIGNNEVTYLGTNTIALLRIFGDLGDSSDPAVQLCTLTPIKKSCKDSSASALNVHSLSEGRNIHGTECSILSCQSS